MRPQVPGRRVQLLLRLVPRMKHRRRSNGVNLVNTRMMYG